METPLITSVAGCKFGDTKENVLRALKGKYQVCEDYENRSAGYSGFRGLVCFEMITIGGIMFDKATLFFPKTPLGNLLSTVLLEIYCKTKEDAIHTLNLLHDVYSKKYPLDECSMDDIKGYVYLDEYDNSIMLEYAQKDDEYVVSVSYTYEIYEDDIPDVDISEL